MKIRCLIVDDEPLAIQLIENHLSLFENFEVSFTANNAFKALEIIKSNHIDLLFCDINMPLLSGLDLLKTLKNAPKTIITTAYREFAFESYEIDVVDYLLKPIIFERFFKAIERYLRSNSIENYNGLENLNQYENSLITIKSNSIFYIIQVPEILYIESQKDYVKFCLKDREIMSKSKISDLGNNIVFKDFIRIHRSFIVNKGNIASYSATYIDVGKNKLPIGLGYRNEVLKALKNSPSKI